MTESGFNGLQRVLAFSAAAEAATGIALVAAPAVIIPLLVRENTSDLALLLGRLAGVALVALGMACWPEGPSSERRCAPFRAMLTYNALIALFFGYVGAVMQLGGLLLWPAAAIHFVVALLLWMRRTPLTRG